LLGIVARLVVATAFIVHEIRSGGPVERKHALKDEMLADILPCLTKPIWSRHWQSNNRQPNCGDWRS
jgi:hypothetical protein